MADDRIDIEIGDKVDPNIDKKIAAIGTAAKSSHSSVKELAGELAKLRSNSVSELSKALRDNATATLAKAKADSMAAAATDKAAAAYLKSELALNRAVAAETRARTEATKLAAETSKAESAALRLAAAKDKEAAASARAAASQGRATFSTFRQGLDRVDPSSRPSAVNSGASFAALDAKAQRDAAQATADLSRRAAELRAQVDPLWAAQQKYNAELREATALYEKGAIDLQTYGAATVQATTRLNSANAAHGTHNNTLDTAGKKTKLATHELTNLGYQLNDVFVSLASGQKPLTVFIQQGAQIGQIATSSGVGLGGMAKQIGGLLLRFAPLAIGVGVAVGAFALFSRSVSKGVDTKELVNGLGLTRKEIKQLKDVSVDSGDVIKATFQVLAERVGLSLKGMSKFFSDAMDFITKLGRVTLAGLYASFVGTFRGIAAIVKGVFAGKGINEILSDVGDAYTGAFNEADKAMIKFGNDVTKQIRDNKLADLKKQADEIKANRTPKKPDNSAEKAAERRAAALDKVNRALDTEIRNLQTVGPEREAASKFDEINNGLLDKKIKLTDAETASIKAKIAEIIRLQPVQQEMDRMYEEAIGPQRTYDAVLEAGNNLLAQGKISLAEYTRQINLAGQALEDATDPLAQINRQLDDQFELLGKFGRNKSQTEFLQQIREAYRARGESIYDTSGLPAGSDPNGDIVVNGSTKYKPEVQDALNRNKELNDASFRNDTIGNLRSGDDQNKQFVDNYRKMLDEIDELRKQGDISEAESYKYRGQLAEQYAHARLSTEESVLSQLSDLQNSSVKEIAAIGKAAAIAQATIDGYAAVQKALASAPPPFNYILAGVVGVAAAANVAKIAGVGFERGGYTGDGGRKEVMGVVHGQEFVVNANGTNTGRNREFLEMMNRGIDIGRGYEAGGYVGTSTASPVVMLPGAQPNVTVNNYSGEPAEVTQTQRPDGGFDFEVVVGQVEKRLAQRVQQGGTPLNQAHERRYGLNPARGNAR